MIYRSADSTMTSLLLCDTAYLSVSWLESLCDLFLPVVQSQALEERDTLGNTPFQIQIIITAMAARVYLGRRGWLRTSRWHQRCSPPHTRTCLRPTPDCDESAANLKPLPTTAVSNDHWTARPNHGLHGFPGLFTDTSEHIRFYSIVFYFLVFLFSTVVVPCCRLIWLM